MKRTLLVMCALAVGLVVAVNVETYSNSLRPNDVMAMSETVPDEVVPVPQPVPYQCQTYYCSSHHCGGERWMERGPIRRFFHRVRPVRRVLRGIGWLFGIGRRCC